VFFIGVALLINFVINIRILLGLSKNKSENEQVRKPKETKKKLPKRQKDYR
jgi:hypothetical protein